MPRTPDRFPGPREDEAIALEEQAAEPAPGEIRNVSGTLKGADAQGAFEEGGQCRFEALFVGGIGVAAVPVSG